MFCPIQFLDNGASLAQRAELGCGVTLKCCRSREPLTR
jgi:hypothetical protein